MSKALLSYVNLILELEKNKLFEKKFKAKTSIRIEPIKEIMKYLKIDKKELIELISKADTDIVVVPRFYIDVGIKMLEEYTGNEDYKKNKNPLNIKTEDMNGFVISPTYSVKLLNKLRIHSKIRPHYVVKTDYDENHADCYHLIGMAHEIELTRHHAKQKISIQPQNIPEEKNIEIKYRIAFLKYLFHCFYFKNTEVFEKEIYLEEIFMGEQDFYFLRKAYLQNAIPYFQPPEIENIKKSDNKYVTNIKEISYIMLKKPVKNNIKEHESQIAKKEHVIRVWLEHIWEKSNISKRRCFDHLPKFILGISNKNEMKSNNDKIDLSQITKDKDLINKDLSESEKFIYLLEISVEKNNKNLRGFQNQTQYCDTLKSVGIKAKEHQEAIYSIISAKK